MAPVDRPRLIDSHVHFWDPTRPDWYPHLKPDVNLDYLGDTSGMKVKYDRETYRAESTGWQVDGIVHIAATHPQAYLAETAHLNAIGAVADIPIVHIGSVDPGLGLAEIEANLDEHMRSERFRGIRILDDLDYTTDPARSILRMLAERGLVYDLVVHPEGMRRAAKALTAHPEATYVVEHTGWPEVMDDDAFTFWKREIAALADAGENVHCKLSGLPMTLHSFDADRMRPWLEHCLEVFGAGRCLVGSNFPVDRLYGSFDELMSAYADITAQLGEAGQRAVFSENTARIYGVRA